MAVERESLLTCPVGTVFTLPAGETFTAKAPGLYIREDLVNAALDAKLKRK
jgi:hypothetical protein